MLLPTRTGSHPGEPAAPAARMREGDGVHPAVFAEGKQVACTSADITRLFEDHYQWLCRVVVRLLRDRNRAEEVVQDVFVEVYAARERIELITAPAYLKRAAVNRTLTILTRQRRETELLSRGRVDEAARGPEHDVPLEQLVIELLRKLPPQQQTAIVLRFYGDLTDADIADAMSVGIGTVKAYLARAKDRLARELPELDPDR